ncbi:MAG: hypothetical protein RLZZ399_2515 [Verrucomicrobiota bacterium]|jgi:acyl-[acyl-carrier-protein]-phospholipid O-acyltransferase/long-chain-fatty-acid--[acyl-carrier-protein] ligase
MNPPTPVPALAPPIAPEGWQKGFWYLMATQFQNALSDNALKNLVILLLLAHPTPGAATETPVALVGALFAAPFICFSMLGGWLADRFSKQRVMFGVKVAEIGIMFLATAGLGLKSLPLQLLAIFLMGTHSSLFGPSKYGILPEVLPTEKLSWGNGILELLTFLGIILGTVLGSAFAGIFREHPERPGGLLVLVAVLGWWVCRGIPEVPAANPHCAPRINPLTDLWAQLRALRGNRDLWRATWGNTLFYFIAALVQMNLVLYARGVLHLDETQSGLLNAALAVGIGVGSVIAGYASRGRIEYRLIPLGAAAMAASTVPMGISGLGVLPFSLALTTLGMGGGLFIVPICAVLQHRPAPESKGAVQGTASVLSFVGILVSSGIQVLLSGPLHLGPGSVFWFCGLAAAATGVYVAFSRRTPAQSTGSASPQGHEEV